MQRSRRYCHRRAQCPEWPQRFPALGCACSAALDNRSRLHAASLWRAARKTAANDLLLLYHNFAWQMLCGRGSLGRWNVVWTFTPSVMCWSGYKHARPFTLRQLSAATAALQGHLRFCAVSMCVIAAARRPRPALGCHPCGCGSRSASACHLVQCSPAAAAPGTACITSQHDCCSAHASEPMLSPTTRMQQACECVSHRAAHVQQAPHL